MYILIPAVSWLYRKVNKFCVRFISFYIPSIMMGKNILVFISCNSRGYL